jgi:hypothetical protein
LSHNQGVFSRMWHGNRGISGMGDGVSGAQGVPLWQVLPDHWLALLPLAVIWLGIAGLIGYGAGFDDLFRDDDHILYRTNARHRLTRQDDLALERRRRNFFSTLIASPAFWTSVGMAVLGGVVWMRIGHAAGHTALVTPGLGVALLAVLGLTLAAARAALRRPRINMPARLPGDRGLEMLRVGLGVLGGAAVSLGLALAAEALQRHVGPLYGGMEPIDWVFWLGLGLVSIAFSVNFLVSGLAVIALLIALVCLLSLVSRAMGPHGEAAFALMLAVLVGSNGRLFKGRIPSLTYPDPASVQNPNEADSLARNKAKIPLLEPLDNWLALRRKAGCEKPVLVLLATSGGAYRASFWTALVLDRIAAENGEDGALSGVLENTRLIAGASGGMVAGAYMTALCHESGGRMPHAIADAIANDTVAFQDPDVEETAAQKRGLSAGRKRRIPIPRDSLSPVVQQFIRRDLPRAFWPRAFSQDRGVMLDQQWRRLQVSFDDIADSERKALCPSIVFSPMLVETGSVAYISNLDLQPMRRARLRPVHSERGINDDSVELLDALPEARKKLTLATATRLNATFPYVSPAISLPVWPYRRVVDAGYYDNYGSDVIAGWLATPEIQQWITGHCSGVAILEVRAFTRGSELEAAPSRIGRALQGITSPAEGLFNARAASQLLRNNQQMRLVEALYQARLGRDGDDAPRFIRRFVFEAYAEASMSWYLPDAELESLRGLLPEKQGFSIARSEAIDRAVQADQRLSRRGEKYREQCCKIAEEFERLKAFWQECGQCRM